MLVAFAKNMDIGVDVQEIIECQEYREIAKNFFAEEETKDIKSYKDKTCFFISGQQRRLT